MKTSVRFVLCLLLLSTAHQVVATEEADDAPIVKVVLPAESPAYLVQPAGTEKILVALEIVDVSGTGIELDKSGNPRFVDADANVAEFLDSIVSRGSYVNRLGQRVTQIISRIRLERLKYDENGISPPIDFLRLRPQEGEREFMFSRSDMVPVVRFHFRLRDLSGRTSSRDGGYLNIATVSKLWTPAK
jgi:hypothetical protein